MLYCIIIGEEEVSIGNVLFEGEVIGKKNYFCIGFCFLKDEVYDCLKVKEYFKFLLGFYELKISIEEVV